MPCKNKTYHAVHSYTAGKGWILCNAKNAKRGLGGKGDAMQSQCYAISIDADPKIFSINVCFGTTIKELLDNFAIHFSF